MKTGIAFLMFASAVFAVPSDRADSDAPKPSAASDKKAASQTLDPALDPAKTHRAIAKGMSADEVLDRIGKPAEVNPFKAPEGDHAEIWVYRRKLPPIVKQTPATTHPVTANDPITGMGYTSQELTYVQEIIDREEVTSLLMYNGVLVEWKRAVMAKRNFN